MDLISIVDEIENKIKQIEVIRGTIKNRGEQKSIAISNYDKTLAVAIIRLKNGDELEIEGHKIINPIGSITEKIAKGICWQEKLEMEKSEALYKSAVSNMQAVLAQINALQSIFRHIDK